MLEDAFDNGRFDIVIKSLDIEIYIENKISSPLGETQLKRYLHHLNKKNENTKLILLTRDFIEEEDISKYSNKYVFWSEIYEILTDFINKSYGKSNRQMNYLIKQFLKFLEEENMSNEKVSWEYTEGVKSFMNLLNLIRTTLNKIRKENDLIKRVSRMSIGKKYAGFNINEYDYWVGIYYNDLNKLFFEFHDKAPEQLGKIKMNSNFCKTPDGNPSLKYDFDETYFLAFSKEEQKKAIYDFVKECIEFT